MDSLIECINKHTELNIKTIVIPGNHDCDFQINKAVRNALIPSVINQVV
jgi:hypothetical protein